MAYPALELGLGSYSIPSPSEKPIPYLATVFLFIVLFYAMGDSGPNLPEINPLKPFEFTNSRRMTEFVQQSKDIFLHATATFGKNPYRLYSEWGASVVLPADFIHELRSDPRLDFITPASDDSHGYIPGFEPFAGNDDSPKVVTKYLTKALTKLTKPISEEATIVLKQIFTDKKEWHEMVPKDDIIRVVSRMSTRVFMGGELCQDDEWIKASSEYTAAAFGVGWELGYYPRWSRPYVHWFLPSCWRVRRLLADCRRILKPHLERRKVKKSQGVQFDDSIEWFEEVYKNRKYDPATEQITLSLVAIHTTSDLLQTVLIDLARNPELIQPLRDELARVLPAEGLKKTALYNLKLMDSVIKESQRMKPVLLSTWRRLATADITLSNGFKIRKGQKIIANNTHMWDEQWYENASKYDGYRFLNMRSTDEEKYAHLVSTSSKHPGFGHGQHACPGRFFAANEIKIALAHILLKYDWKLPEGCNPQPVPFGMALLPDPTVKMQIRRRKEEIDLDSIDC
ncbi:Cytochrome P450 monooxygenase eqxH [Colletotrichum fructicola]|uniref:Cytochrome P450 monooxygenase eqxH n=1 Tax=Colletotrichum fructicola (strain Nara gc5) TaxID=1213859 RepID=L2FZP4_COLFN|nr:Cytochrome P450 monooxygenase [Colletotrichum fructicola]KAF4476862.1 Cytochrome P450 monooxygenase eqxH [Colletotrichum fructicola Nara gc5]KAI8282962.1 Cytochrome P450 monooxygenase [Colletotrichum sp. SAR11_57]KAE9566254.1 Cytochrome P450 monooxygenase [Colletotrichum fructicola]KAF4419251.1 Cytochrome P450 monooxygenase eqxH [Colletotrichum fructicola]KAF4889625.1 Cytochrome P450 monooxygenase eqxH [Colletotrichum fructicola]